MKGSFPDRNVVRQYLLGRLDDQKAQEDELSEAILLNDDLSEMVEAIEDEIIEDYLDDTLDSTDKKAVNEYFLRSPARKEALQFARLLRHHFNTKTGDVVKTGAVTATAVGQNVVYGEADVRSAVARRSHFMLYGQFAVVIVLSISGLIYVSAVRKGQTRIEGELAQERKYSAALVKEMQVLQPPIVSLTLVSDRSRSASTQLAHVQIKPSTQRIIVDIALQDGSAGPYDVRLETKSGRGSAWSARLLPLVSASGDARLVFDVPAQGIESGIYSFVVSSSGPGGGALKYYDFQAVTKSAALDPVKWEFLPLPSALVIPPGRLVDVN